MQFLEYFFQDEDAAFFKSLGLNCIRLPFNYRHFEGTHEPFSPSSLGLIDVQMT